LELGLRRASSAIAVVRIEYIRLIDERLIVLYVTGEKDKVSSRPREIFADGLLRGFSGPFPKASVAATLCGKD